MRLSARLVSMILCACMLLAFAACAPDITDISDTSVAADDFDTAAVTAESEKTDVGSDDTEKASDPPAPSMIYDTEIFDIDGDGKEEICEVGGGGASGLFSFTFKVSEADAETHEYYATYFSDSMDFELVVSNDGKLRLQGTTQQGEVRLYDITLADGYITITKDGVPISGFSTGITDNLGATQNVNLDSLKANYPAYFGLDASKGLDVIVWQMAAGSFSFGMLPHSESRDWLSSELWDLRSVSAVSMRAILSTYDISEDKIYIVPWQNPISSYISDYSSRWAAMDDVTPYQNMYITMVRNMLFENTLRSRYPTVYESEWFDVDGDGEREYNMIGMGLVDGVFMFCYIISEDGKTAEYYDIFYSEPMSFQFIVFDGHYRLRGRNEKGEVRVFDISFKDGHICLTENSDALGAFESQPDELDFANAGLSAVNYVVITDGMTGKKEYMRDILHKDTFPALINAVRKIRVSDPVSNKGYSGFRYRVELYDENHEIYSFSIASDDSGAYLICGYYETVEDVHYPRRYKLTDSTYENLVDVIEKCFE